MNDAEDMGKTEGMMEKDNETMVAMRQSGYDGQQN